MHGKGGACVAKGGACMVKGGMCGKGGVHGKVGHAWQSGGGGMCGERQGEACMVCMPPFYEIQPVNVWEVRILLECILVWHEF